MVTVSKATAYRQMYLALNPGEKALVDEAEEKLKTMIFRIDTICLLLFLNKTHPAQINSFVGPIPQTVCSRIR